MYKFLNQRNAQRAAALPLVLTVLVLATMGLAYYLKDADLFRQSTSVALSNRQVELQAKTNFQLVSDEVLSVINNQIEDQTGNIRNLFDHAFFCSNNADLRCLREEALRSRIQAAGLAINLDNFEFQLSCLGQGSGDNRQNLRCDTLSDGSAAAFPKIIRINFTQRDDSQQVQARGSADISLVPQTLNAYSSLYFGADRVDFGAGSTFRGQVGVFFNPDSRDPANLVFHASAGNDPIVFQELFETNLSSINITDVNVSFEKGVRPDSSTNVRESVEEAMNNALASGIPKTLVQHPNLPSNPAALLNGGADIPDSISTPFGSRVRDAQVFLGKSGSGSSCDNRLRYETRLRAQNMIVLPMGVEPPAGFLNPPADTNFSPALLPNFGAIRENYSNGGTEYPHIARFQDANTGEWSSWISMFEYQATQSSSEITISDSHTINARLSNHSNHTDYRLRVSPIDGGNKIEVCNDQGLSLVSNTTFVLDSSFVVDGPADQYQRNVTNTAFIMEPPPHLSSPMPVVLIDPDTRALNGTRFGDLNESSDNILFRFDGKVIGSHEKSRGVSLDRSLLEDGSSPLGGAYLNGGEVTATPSFLRRVNEDGVVQSGFVSTQRNFATSNAPGATTAIFALLTRSIANFQMSVLDPIQEIQLVGVSWRDALQDGDLIPYTVSAGGGPSGGASAGMNFVGGELGGGSNVDVNDNQNPLNPLGP